MKKNFLLLLCSLFLLSSCFVSFGDHQIKPSDNIVKQTFTQSAFDRIDIDVMAKIKFVQSIDGDYRVALSAPDNYIDLFDMKVSDGVLKIRFNKKNTSIDTENVKMLIYSPTLRGLKNSGIASLVADSLRSEVLTIDNSGVGSLNLSGLSLMSVDVDCSGVGSIVLAGETTRAKLECSGVGSINAEHLQARSLYGDVSGVGGITCNATDSLKAEVSGVGSLKYTGNPHHKKLHRSGVGGIQPLD